MIVMGTIGAAVLSVMCVAIVARVVACVRMVRMLKKAVEQQRQRLAVASEERGAVLCDASEERTRGVSVETCTLAKDAPAVTSAGSGTVGVSPYTVEQIKKGNKMHIACNVGGVNDNGVNRSGHNESRVATHIENVLIFIILFFTKVSGGEDGKADGFWGEDGGTEKKEDVPAWIAELLGYQDRSHEQHRPGWVFGSIEGVHDRDEVSEAHCGESSHRRDSESGSAAESEGERDADLSDGRQEIVGLDTLMGKVSSACTLECGSEPETLGGGALLKEEDGEYEIVPDVTRVRNVSWGCTLGCGGKRGYDHVSVDSTVDADADADADKVSAKDPTILGRGEDVKLKSFAIESDGDASRYFVRCESREAVSLCEAVGVDPSVGQVEAESGPSGKPERTSCFGVRRLWFHPW